MLDKLPPEARHLVLMLLVPVLAYVASDVVPQLGIHPLLAGLVGVVLAQLIAYFTPLTRQYGIGSGDREDRRG